MIIKIHFFQWSSFKTHQQHLIERINVKENTVIVTNDFPHQIGQLKA